jgi:16S rRNA (cytidine1402-2'-O)-methyltransferase
MLSIVATPIGNLEDITLRALRELKAADLIVAEDTRVTGVLLKRYEIEKRLVSFHAKSGPAREDELLALLAQGLHLALVTDAGTPGISDPGERLVRRAIEQGIQVTALPGATAFVPALLLSGLPASEFTFLGFIPHKKGRQTFIKQLPSYKHSVVFYESVHRIKKLLEEMTALLPPETPVAVARELTKMFEEVHRGTLAEVAATIAAQKPLGEYVVVVSPVDHPRADD